MNPNISKNTVLIKIILVTSIFMYLACNSETNTEVIISTEEEVDPLTTIADRDTIAKWQEWSLSSDEGLWENDTSHNVQLTLLDTYGGEDDLNPPFFSVKWMQVSGDTLFIADRARECLVCMNSEGQVLWEYGEPGAGPGCFNRIGPIAVSETWVAVCNIDGDRIDLLSRSGNLISDFDIANPLFIESIDSETFVVLSRAASGGDVHLFDVNTGYINSFGECPWQGGEIMQRSTHEYSAECFDNRYLVVNNFFEYNIVVFDLLEQVLLTEFARVHPSRDLPSSTTTEYDDGYISGTYYFLLGRLFNGPEGVINIKLDAIQKDGTVINSRTTIGPAPVTIIDRYNLLGEFLDSYCIPIPNCTECRYSEPFLYVSQSYTGLIYKFKFE